LKTRSRIKALVVLLGVLAAAFLFVALVLEKWHLRIAGPAALGVTFGGCPHPGVDGPGAEYLAQVDRWVELREVRGVGGAEEGDTALTARATDDGVEGEYTYLLHDSYLPGVEWALKNDGAAWLAMSAEEFRGPQDVAYVVAFGPGGEGFLPGDCQDRFRSYLAERSGEGFLAEMVSTQPDDLPALFARHGYE
jgi:hypothetical protein